MWCILPTALYIPVQWHCCSCSHLDAIKHVHFSLGQPLFRNVVNYEITVPQSECWKSILIRESECWKSILIRESEWTINPPFFNFYLRFSFSFPTVRSKLNSIIYFFTDDGTLIATITSMQDLVSLLWSKHC